MLSPNVSQTSECPKITNYLHTASTRISSSQASNGSFSYVYLPRSLRQLGTPKLISRCRFHAKPQRHTIQLCISKSLVTSTTPSVQATSLRTPSPGLSVLRPLSSARIRTSLPMQLAAARGGTHQGANLNHNLPLLRNALPLLPPPSRPREELNLSSLINIPGDHLNDDCPDIDQGNDIFQLFVLVFFCLCCLIYSLMLPFRGVLCIPSSDSPYGPLLIMVQWGSMYNVQMNISFWYDLNRMVLLGTDE